MPGQGTSEIRLRLSEGSDPDREGPDPTRTVDGCFGSPFEGLLSQRRSEAEEFYNALVPEHILGDGRQVVRQAAAGLLWTKQFFHHVVKDWLEGDPTQPAPPPGRSDGRNRDWPHVYNRDVISMPDSQEDARAMAATFGMRTIRTGATCRCSTSISTPKRDEGAAPAIRPGGARSPPGSSTIGPGRPEGLRPTPAGSRCGPA